VGWRHCNAGSVAHRARKIQAGAWNESTGANLSVHYSPCTASTRTSFGLEGTLVKLLHLKLGIHLTSIRSENSTFLCGIIRSNPGLLREAGNNKSPMHAPRCKPCARPHKQKILRAAAVRKL